MAEQPGAGDVQDAGQLRGAGGERVAASHDITAATINTRRERRASSRLAAMYTMSRTAGVAIGGYWQAA